MYVKTQGGKTHINKQDTTVIECGTCGLKMVRPLAIGDGWKVRADGTWRCSKDVCKASA
jgi:hypothetical protein